MLVLDRCLKLNARTRSMLEKSLLDPSLVIMVIANIKYILSLKDGEYYIWEDGWPMDYSNWGAAGENGKTICGSMKAEDGLWYHSDCDSSEKPYTCKYTTGASSGYLDLLRHKLE